MDAVAGHDPRLESQEDISNAVSAASNVFASAVDGGIAVTDAIVVAMDEGIAAVGGCLVGVIAAVASNICTFLWWPFPLPGAYNGLSAAAQAGIEARNEP